MACICFTFAQILLGIALIYKLSKKYSWIVYYAKMVSYLLIAFIAQFSCIPIALIQRKRNHRNGDIMGWILRSYMRVLGCEFEVIGNENIDRTNGGVILLNHQSCLDMVAAFHLWPIIDNITAIAKKFIIYPLPITYLLGTVFINRSKPDESKQRLNDQISAITNNKAKLLIFPEGTRSSATDLLPFKKGSFHVAVKSQSIIQPVVVSQYYFLDSKYKLFREGHATISILPAINCKGLSSDDVNDLVIRTHEIMQKEYYRLNELYCG